MPHNSNLVRKSEGEHTIRNKRSKLLSIVFLQFPSGKIQKTPPYKELRIQVYIQRKTCPGHSSLELASWKNRSSKHPEEALYISFHPLSTEFQKEDNKVKWNFCSAEPHGYISSITKLQGSSETLADRLLVVWSVSRTLAFPFPSEASLNYLCTWLSIKVVYSWGRLGRQEIDNLLLWGSLWRVAAVQCATPSGSMRTKYLNVEAFV